MTVTYGAATQQARMDQVINKADAGAGNALLRFYTSNAYTTTVCTITLSKPSMTRSNGPPCKLSIAGLPKTSDNAGSTLTAAYAQILDSAGNVVVTGLTVGTSGSDINLNTTTVNSGQAITLNPPCDIIHP